MERLRQKNHRTQRRKVTRGFSDVVESRLTSESRAPLEAYNTPAVFLRSTLTLGVLIRQGLGLMEGVMCPPLHPFSFQSCSLTSSSSSTPCGNPSCWLQGSL